MKIPEHHFEDGIPVFKPNAEEFSNFATLISSIQSVASCVGLAKIIPPFEISVRVPNNIAISNPIQQCIYKGLLPNGAYQTLNMQSNKSYSLDDWISLDSIPAYHTPDYSSDHCDFLEKHYWKHLTYGNILYGADIKGSLFENAKSTSPWNLNRIDNLLNNLQHSLPGVNIPYLYFGLFKSTFAWHVEDMDLYSIKYSRLTKLYPFRCA